MKRLSRDEFAAAALTGVLARATKFTDISKMPARLAFEQADQMIALSAPDVVETLEELVLRLEHENLTMSAVRAAIVPARAVLARYKEPIE